MFALYNLDRGKKKQKGFYTLLFVQVELAYSRVEVLFSQQNDN